MTVEGLTLVNNALALKTQWVAERDEMLAVAGKVTAVATAADLEAAGALHAKMVRHRKALAPKVAPPATTANRMVTRWTFTVQDPAAVPREYCVPDERLIRRYMVEATGAGFPPAMPGVEFTKTVSVEGKA